MNEFLKKLQDSDVKINLDELKDLDEKDNLPLKKVETFLNEDQQKAMASIFNWLYQYKGQRNPDNQYALRGSAGTGKTTLIGEVLKNIDKKLYSSGRICLCAPTHKAKKVILSKTGWPNGDTLQSLLGLKPDTDIENFDPNKPEFAQTGQRKIVDYSLIIIDESSMINTNLYKMLSESSCMLLFIGDHKQLKPVKENSISMALSNPIHSYTLTQPARQKVGNPLLNLLNIISEDIDNNTNVYLDILKGGSMINELGEGYEVINDSVKFFEKMKAEFTKEEFITDKNYIRYLAWQNASITKTNRYIRKNIFGNENTCCKEELMLCYRTIMEEGEEVLLTNSDDYIIEEVRDGSITDFSIPLLVDEVKLRCVDTGHIADVFILKRTEENYKNYTLVYDDFLTTAKAQRGSYWKKVFYPFKNTILVPDKIEYIGQLGTKETIAKDIDYGYGITTHKSQGSTYNTVFVNHKDISEIISFAKPYEVNDAKAMRRNLVYVALSRASRKAYLII